MCRVKGVLVHFREGVKVVKKESKRALIIGAIKIIPFEQQIAGGGEVGLLVKVHAANNCAYIDTRGLGS